MADQFVQRMKSRTHARQNKLGLVNSDSDKENSASSFSEKSLNSIIGGSTTQKNSKTSNLDNIVPKSSIKNESEEASRASLVTTQSLHSLSATSLSPNKASDSILNASANITSSRSRFQHLAERTQQMQEWEDDYTYHSVCGGFFKEVENSDLGVHDASTVLSVANSNMLHDITEISSSNSIEKVSLECEKSIISPYYFGDFHTPEKYKISDCDKSSKDKSIYLLHSSCTPHGIADASFHTAYSSLSPQSNTSLAKSNRNCASNSNTNFKSMPPSTPKAVAASSSVTPTRRLAWDKQLLKSLEAQGFTPSTSRSKLAYDYRDRSPIKEKELSTLKSISKDSSKPVECDKSVVPEYRPELPRIVGMQEKKKTLQSSASVESQSSKSLEGKESSHVSGLRSQWEQHIRDASPERQMLQRGHSPSPERNFKPSHFSRERSPSKGCSTGSTNSQRERSMSPSKNDYLSNSTKISDVSALGFNRGSVARASYRSISPHKPEPCGEIVKSDIAMPETVPVVTNPAASVRERAAAFASLAGVEKGVPNKDPAELSLKDRLKLFEKKKGTALIPKAPFGQCISGKILKSNLEEKLAEQATNQFEPYKESIFVEERSVASHADVSGKSSMKLSVVDSQRKLFENIEDNWRETDINSKTLNDRGNDMQVLYNRFRRAPNSSSHKSDVSPTPESDSEYPESDDSSVEQEMLISNASRGAMGPPKPPRTFMDTSPSKEFLHSLPPGSSKSPSKRLNSTELDESYSRSPRKEYVPKIKPGCLFPSLSDIETQSETAESDEDVKNLSFAESVLTCASGESLGTQIQKMAQKNNGVSTVPQLSVIEEDANLKRSVLQSSLSSSTLDALEAIDEALDQALEDDDEPTPPKRGRKEDDGGNSVYKTPKLCQSSSNSHDSSDISLAHSISMYRKQKPADVVVTPVRQIMRKPDLCSPSKDSPISPSVTITSRIRVLQEEEEHQLKVISQASNAISVVVQHPEHHGTIQHIEAEKLLLVAAQKRQCAVHEIQRLKAEGALGKRDYWSQEDDSCRGSISISNITLPLKSDFLSKLNGQSMHHFVVLVKHRDQVITSELQATPDCIVEGAITFPNLMSLYGLTADFNISLEVYAFRVEPLAHAGIKKDHSRMKLTPLKRLQKEAKSFSPAMSSPGGPYSIRSTSFSLIGFANLNINTLTRNAWTLEKVPFSSPVNGHLLMHVSVAMEGGVKESSFLTMFDDVGGFGAWNRRWCVLGGPFIRYWSYPEDECKKECMGTIDLRMCTTRKVELVSRELCARHHTFQLTFMRPVQAGDKSDLVHEIKNNTLISKILLSADSREERILWCNKLNKALASIRSWDPDALRPEDFQV